jgi:hypothetical protein
MKNPHVKKRKRGREQGGKLGRKLRLRQAQVGFVLVATPLSGVVTVVQDMRYWEITQTVKQIKF